LITAVRCLRRHYTILLLHLVTVTYRAAFCRYRGHSFVRAGFCVHHRSAALLRFTLNTFCRSAVSRYCLLRTAPLPPADHRFDSVHGFVSATITVSHPFAIPAAVLQFCRSVSRTSVPYDKTFCSCLQLPDTTFATLVLRTPPTHFRLPFLPLPTVVSVWLPTRYARYALRFFYRNTYLRVVLRLCVALGYVTVCVLLLVRLTLTLPYCSAYALDCYCVCYVCVATVATPCLLPCDYAYRLHICSLFCGYLPTSRSFTFYCFTFVAFHPLRYHVTLPLLRILTLRPTCRPLILLPYAHVLTFAVRCSTPAATVSIFSQLTFVAALRWITPHSPAVTTLLPDFMLITAVTTFSFVRLGSSTTLITIPTHYALIRRYRVPRYHTFVWLHVSRIPACCYGYAMRLIVWLFVTRSTVLLQVLPRTFTDLRLPALPRSLVTDLPPFYRFLPHHAALLFIVLRCYCLYRYRLRSCNVLPLRYRCRLYCTDTVCYYVRIWLLPTATLFCVLVLGFLLHRTLLRYRAALRYRCCAFYDVVPVVRYTFAFVLPLDLPVAVTFYCLTVTVTPHSPFTCRCSYTVRRCVTFTFVYAD